MSLKQSQTIIDIYTNDLGVLGQGQIYLKSI